jgi:hypothetical protein
VRHSADLIWQRFSFVTNGKVAQVRHSSRATLGIKFAAPAKHAPTNVFAAVDQLGFASLGRSLTLLAVPGA